MFEVYHYPLCPFSRKLRIILKEKGLEYELVQEQFWLRRREFLKMNPGGHTPVVVDLQQKVFAGNTAIFEYFDEKFTVSPTIYGNEEQRTEIRRIEEWFDVKFYHEVTRYIFSEKIVKTLMRTEAPNSQAIQAAKKNLITHISYIEFLLSENRYLAGDLITRADFAAAAQVSVLDYVNDVPWSSYPKVKQWYALIKSRPSFKPILNDIVPGLNPPPHYNNPDF
jgi:glutathione S-transferase